MYSVFIIVPLMDHFETPLFPWGKKFIEIINVQCIGINGGSKLPLLIKKNENLFNQECEDIKKCLYLK